MIDTKNLTACKNYILAQASKHEQAACYARYTHDKLKEDAEVAEQQTLLQWATALSAVLDSQS